MENARATGLFLHALSCEYGAQATSGMLRRVRISLDGALTPRVISRARNDLERNRQASLGRGSGSASSGARATSSTLRIPQAAAREGPCRAERHGAALGCAARPAEPGQHLLRQRRAEIRAERVWPARGATRPDTPQLPASATASHRAIADFMGALATRSDALEPDLRRLFSALQDAPEFALFRNASLSATRRGGLRGRADRGNGPGQPALAPAAALQDSRRRPADRALRPANQPGQCQAGTP